MNVYVAYYLLLKYHNDYEYYNECSFLPISIVHTAKFVQW